MARYFGDLQLVRGRLLLALLPLVFATLTYGQSNPGDPIPAEPKVSQTLPQPGQAVATNPGVEPTTPATPEELRQDEIKADTKRLYQLSVELRAEVAKTYKESLSLSVIKRAEEVEKAAKSLKALMNKEAAASKH